MTEVSLTVFFYLAILIVILLSLCVIYLVFAYRRLLDKYTDLTLSGEKSELGKKIKLETNEFVNKKIDSEVKKAVDQAVNLIAKKGDEVAGIMRRETIEKLKEKEVGEEKAVAAEYDKVDENLKKYESQKVEEIKIRANEILVKVTSDVLPELINPEAQKALVIKALENAKRQKLF